MSEFQERAQLSVAYVVLAIAVFNVIVHWSVTRHVSDDAIWTAVFTLRPRKSVSLCKLHVAGHGCKINATHALCDRVALLSYAKTSNTSLVGYPTRPRVRRPYSVHWIRRFVIADKVIQKPCWLWTQPKKMPYELRTRI